MIFLGVPSGFSTHYILMIISVLFVIIVLLLSGWYYFKHQKVAKGHAASIFFGILGIFIISLPVGYFIGLSMWNLNIIVLFTIVEMIIVIVALVIFVYLIESKKNILEKAGVKEDVS